MAISTADFGQWASVRVGAVDKGVERVYALALADLCGESYAKNNSHNLTTILEFHDLGWEWKDIYFAVIDYNDRMEKELDQHDPRDDEWVRGSFMVADTEEHREVFYDCLENARQYHDTNMIREEFLVLAGVEQ